MALPNYAFFNGRIVRYGEAKVGVLTHGLNYGTGVFGGIRAYWNDEAQQLFIFRPRDHFRRFLESTKLLRMEFSYSEDDLTKALLALLGTENHKTDCYIRPVAFYSDEIIGVRLHDLTPALAMVAIPFGKYVEKDEGSHVTVSSWRRVDDNVIPARGKITGSYINSAFAKTDAQRAGFDEAIILTHDGHICEGSAENVFLIRNGVAITPPITDNILEGITRQTVITLLHDELGVNVVERSIDRSEIYLANEAFFTGTGVQITAITRVDYRSIGTGKMGEITTKLRELFFNVVRGRVKKYHEWCTPVYETKRAR
ncbi:branched-chain amino acid transaminase [candidate division KSB1 bacterium]|nr:branched-chain amino acid transaminase [candidate division KSB1 bacterium]